MKAEALQALQHIRTTLACQLTPEAIEELVGPIQQLLDDEMFVCVSREGVMDHNATVDIAMEHAMDCYTADRDKPGLGKLFNELFDSIRALCL